MQQTVAERYGRRWSAGAAVRAERFADMSRPAWAAVAAAAGIGPGDRVLDVGCGSGEFARLAADLGAGVAGIDAATGMIELAGRLVPAADLRVGTLEALPRPDGAFDVVTGLNAFQFALDLPAALAEARPGARPRWPGGGVPLGLRRGLRVGRRRARAGVAAPYRRSDGSYLFPNRYRYLISSKRTP